MLSSHNYAMAAGKNQQFQRLAILLGTKDVNQGALGVLRVLASWVSKGGKSGRECCRMLIA